MKNPKFLVTSDQPHQLSFVLTARNGQALLESPVYPSLDKCREGIQAIRDHAVHDERYQRQATAEKKWYFELTTAEGSLLATGRPYTQRHGCERGIRAAKRVAPAAPVEYPDGSVEYLTDDDNASAGLFRDGQSYVHPAVTPSAGNPFHAASGDSRPWWDQSASAAVLGTPGAPIPVSESPVLARRRTTLQGRVLGLDGKPVAGVWITIPGQTAYGHVLSRADGSFMMPVYGGGVLPIRYEKPGYLPVQRRVYVHWQDFFRLPDVVMPVHEAISASPEGAEIPVLSETEAVAQS
ncbi:MAG: DUF1508 domain-containing protein [Candidatus Tectomicrobia bacterium]|nr:DUF1508 domain-containing protein [Candidatus Tectomicrobia bacterium]